MFSAFLNCQFFTNSNCVYIYFISSIFTAAVPVVAPVGAPSAAAGWGKQPGMWFDTHS